MGLEWLEERPASPLWEHNFWGTFIKEAEMHFWTFLNTRLCSNIAKWLEETLIQAHQEAGLSSLNQMASWWLNTWTVPLLARDAVRASYVCPHEKTVAGEGGNIPWCGELP